VKPCRICGRQPEVWELGAHLWVVRCVKDKVGERTGHIVQTSARTKRAAVAEWNATHPTEEESR
jgi:hypothetical protein